MKINWFKWIEYGRWNMNGSIEIEQNTTKEITNLNEKNEMEKNLKTLHI